MNKTFKYIIVLTAVIIGSTSAWANNKPSNPRVKFIIPESHNTASAYASGIDSETGLVTITVTPDEGYRCVDGDLTAKLSVGTGSAEARPLTRGTGPDIDASALVVGFVRTNVFTITLPSDEDLNVTITVSFSEKDTFTPEIAVDDWEYGNAATTPHVSEYNPSAGPSLVFKYGTGWSNDALVNEADYSANPPVAVGEYYMVAYVVGDADYNATHSEPTKFEIQPRELTISSIDVPEKTYDGTTNVSLSNVVINTNDIVNSENVKIVATSGSYASKNADDYAQVTFSGFELRGSNKDNYYCRATSFTTTGIILPRTIYLAELPIVTKTYDGSTKAIPDYKNVRFDNIIYGDEVSLFWLEAYFEDKNVGENKKVIFCNMTEYGFSGTDYSNYQLGIDDGIKESQGNITPAPLTVTAENKLMKVGEATPAFTVTYGDEDGNSFVGNEDASFLGGTLAFDCAYTTSSPVGNYAITPKGLTSTNYDITFVSGTLKVILADLELFAANSTHLWATYCDNCVRTVPDGCKAWTVTGISNNTVTVSEVSGTTMPAYTPLLISRSEAGTDAVVAEYSADGTAPVGGYDATAGLAMSTATGWSYYGNAGSTAFTDEGTTKYIFPFGTAGATEQSYILKDGRFVVVSDKSSGIAAHRCWLNVSKDALAQSGNSNARSLDIIVDDETTGMTPPLTPPLEGAGSDGGYNAGAVWYTIDGRRLTKAPTQKGIYIHNGKKVVMK